MVDLTIIVAFLLPSPINSATGGLWQTGALAGKPAGWFFATATQGGGQETTALTAVTQLAHHGMVFVPTGFADPAMFSNEAARGGSAYGAGELTYGDIVQQSRGCFIVPLHLYELEHSLMPSPKVISLTLAPPFFTRHAPSLSLTGTLTNGDGSRMPSELELNLARGQGKSFGTFVRALTLGRAALAAETGVETASP